MESSVENQKATNGRTAIKYFQLADPGDAPYTGYREYLQHPRFQNIRREAMEKASWKCQRCKTARATQVHHLRYPPWGTFDVIENLLPVCYKCHCEIHGKER